MGYQQRDRHIIDYGLYQLPGVAPYEGQGMFRGPRVTGGDYIACVGAAQTFGCFCPQPYPVLLASKLGIETLNLGYGGAGPTFHNSNTKLLHYINGARLVIVQVLSGRSQSNSYFRTPGHARQGIRVADGRWMPQPLYDRTGAPATVIFQDGAGRDGVTVTHNNYYPSPEMHVDAADALAAPCRDLLRARRPVLRPRAAPPARNR